MFDCIEKKSESDLTTYDYFNNKQDLLQRDSYNLKIDDTNNFDGDNTVKIFDINKLKNEKNVIIKFENNNNNNNILKLKNNIIFFYYFYYLYLLLIHNH